LDVVVGAALVVDVACGGGVVGVVIDGAGDELAAVVGAVVLDGGTGGMGVPEVESVVSGMLIDGAEPEGLLDGCSDVASVGIDDDGTDAPGEAWGLPDTSEAAQPVTARIATATAAVMAAGTLRMDLSWRTAGLVGGEGAAREPGGGPRTEGDGWRDGVMGDANAMT
jgi:hypothetical protein